MADANAGGPGRERHIVIDRGDIADRDRLQVRWGGRTDLIFTEDVARAFLAAAGARLDGARGPLSHVEQPIPFPDALDDAAYQRELGPAPATPLEVGVRVTLEKFARLQKEGRLDARELE